MDPTWNTTPTLQLAKIGASPWVPALGLGSQRTVLGAGRQQEQQGPGWATGTWLQGPKTEPETRNQAGAPSEEKRDDLSVKTT